MKQRHFPWLPSRPNTDNSHSSILGCIPMIRSTLLVHRSSRPMSTFTRLVRFVPKAADAAAHQPSTPLIGQPTDPDQDVGLASLKRETITVDLFSGSSVLNAGTRLGKQAVVERILSPLSASEVGTIRCIGLNYRSHAEEVGMAIPETPVLFMKPSTALGNPYPSPTVLPRAFLQDDAADFESEIAVVIGKSCKDVTKQQAFDYVFGITAANDVSSREAQFAQSQWCYSKSFDTACPLGPALVHIDAIRQHVQKVAIRGELNGDTVQQSTLDDLIFSIPTLIEFLSRGTTLPAGTVILTGTPAGVGWTRSPRLLLKDNDEFRVYVSHGVGTLINRIQDE